jgi:transcription antitermination factor NusG
MLSHPLETGSDKEHIVAVNSSLPWLALRVRVRSESVAAEALKGRGYQVVSPTIPERRRYSDRIRQVNTPVFPGYVFIRFSYGSRAPILSSPAVQYIVSFGQQPALIPDQVISDVCRMINNGARPIPYFKAGDHIRVEYGPLAGVEGIYVRHSAKNQLVVSIDVLQRSVALHVDESQVQLITTT